MTRTVDNKVISREQLVEQHFRDDYRFWHDVYTQQTLAGEVYRARRSAVLQFVDELDLRPGARIIDVGCGAGSTTVALAERGMRVDAVDEVPQMIALTDAAVRDHGVQGLVDVRSANVHRLPFADETFDCALAIGVMEWMSSCSEPLAELRRVLRPGGWLIANVDNSHALHCLADPRMCPAASIVKRQACKWAEAAGLVQSVARSSRCSPRDFDSALRSAGFAKFRSLTTGFGPFTILGFPVLPQAVAIRFHTALQRLADRGTRCLRDGGDAYLALAQKSLAESTERSVAGL